MSIPGALHDGADTNGQLIADVRLGVASRVAYAPVRHKLDEGWVDRIDGEGAVEMRVTAEGITSQEWVATLYARRDARARASYHVAMTDGDSHTGSFMVEELSEQADAQNRRRFRLVLLSAGRITYAAAP